MDAKSMDDRLQVPARGIAPPVGLSAHAKAYLIPQPTPGSYPALEDKDGWRTYIAAADQGVLPFLQQLSAPSGGRRSAI